MAVVGGTGDAELLRKIEDYKVRERIYFAGLIGQEAELSQLRRMAADIQNAYGDVSRAAVRNALYDPTANMEVLMLRQKAREKDQEIERLREELEANRFDQRLPAGQALMRKCKALLNENHELGEQIREERLSDFRAALQAEQRLNAELAQKVQEASDFCREISQENEKLEGTFSKVFVKLQEARAELERLKIERREAKARRKEEKNLQKARAAAAAAQAAAVETPVLEPGFEVPSVTADGYEAHVEVPLQPPAGVFDYPVPSHSVEVAADVEMPVPEERPGGRERKEKKHKDKKEKKDRERLAASAPVPEPEPEAAVANEPEPPQQEREAEPVKEPARERERRRRDRDRGEDNERHKEREKAKEKDREKEKERKEERDRDREGDRDRDRDRDRERDREHREHREHRDRDRERDEKPSKRRKGN